MRPALLVLLLISLPCTAAEVKTAGSSPESKAALESHASDGSNFERLEALFNAGTLPSFPSAGLIGMAGRCFDRNHEDAVKGAAYIVYSGGGQNGPLDPSVSIQTLWDDSLNYFDRLSASSFAYPGSRWFPVCVADDSERAVIGRNSASYLRRNGQYWIEKIATIDDGCASYYCYYYLTMSP